MGEAIARFREMALTIRRVCDERHSQPRGRAVKSAAAKKFAKACREHFLEHEKAGMHYPARYVDGLCRLRREAERHPDPPPPGKFDLPLYIEWLPEPFAAKEPGESEIRRARSEAVKEAVRWGSLAGFSVVEARIKALDAAAEMLLQYAGSERYENPPEEDLDEHPEYGTHYLRPSHEQADRDYIARHEEFAEALDALAPFIEEEPPAAAIRPTSEEQTNGSRSRVGRPRNDEVLARDLLDGWREYEPEEGRRTIDRYLAQRPDVRALKTEEARQRKIVSLRTALESAQSLRQSKARQKRRARG